MTFFCRKQSQQLNAAGWQQKKKTAFEAVFLSFFIRFLFHNNALYVAAVLAAVAHEGLLG